MPKLFASPVEIQAKHSLMVIYSFLTLFVVNVGVVYLAHLIFPHQVVLGTGTISPFWALHFSMLKLTLAGMLTLLLVTVYEWKNKTAYSPSQWMGTFLVVNTVSLWLIARFANNLGLGLSAWYVVLLLASALDWVQGIAMMALGKKVK